MATLTQYDFTQQVDYSSSLATNIQQSTISTALDHIDTSGSGPTMAVAVWFKDALCSADITTLNTVMGAYVNVAPVPQSPLINVSSFPPFGAKTIDVSGVTKKLYARTTGVQYPVIIGTNTISYTATLAWVKLLGVEAINTEANDTVDFKVYDNSSGTYSGVPNKLLNQFGFTVNMPKDFYRRMANFDADLYVGMIIEMTYISASAKTVGFNLIMDQVV